MSRQQRRAETIHRTKLFGGRLTAEEYHAKYAFPVGAKCAGCGKGGSLTTRIISLAPLDEMRKRDPMVDYMAANKPTQLFSTLVPIRGADGKPQPYLRIATVYACGACSTHAERAAAHGPSWCIVEINRGPGKDKVVSGYTGAVQ